MAVLQTAVLATSPPRQYGVKYIKKPSLLPQKSLTNLVRDFNFDDREVVGIPSNRIRLALSINRRTKRYSLPIKSGFACGHTLSLPHQMVSGLDVFSQSKFDFLINLRSFEFRKEVIHPQLRLGIPCYDLSLIADFRLPLTFSKVSLS